jgi:uncharacterized Ntn-hydrolase superfamily protein
MCPTHQKYKEFLIMTYSIVARDPETGEIGVAVQTALPGVGRLCPWAEAGVGAVATQALVRMSHGPSGLALMRNGHTAPQALAAVLAGDNDPQIRQIGMIDAKGNVDSFTGDGTIRYAGHHVDEIFAVQANMMQKDTVPAAMSLAFKETEGSLILRILAALDAAQAEGGDFRGSQSAALKIVSGDLPANTWSGVLFDIRVDDNKEPLKELRRIANRHLAYQKSGQASQAAASGDIATAMAQYEEAIALDPDDDQIKFWFLLTVADEHDQLEQVEPLFRDLFKKNSMWVECLQRYAEARPLKTEGLLEKLIALGA